jgi:ribosome maturation protein SDO1
VARIKSHGKNFEIMVVAEKALEFKKTGKGNLQNIMESPGVFSDIKKGLKVSEDDLDGAFGTVDEFKVAEKIIKDGEIQLPSSYKEKERETRYKQIVDFLASSCSDPSGRPIPAERINDAISQSGVKIDEKKSTEEQSLTILKLIQKILPIKLAMKRITLKVPAIYTGQLYGYLKHFILKEDWLSNGDLSCVVEIPSRMQSEFYDKINSISHGSVISKEM